MLPQQYSHYFSRKGEGKKSHCKIRYFLDYFLSRKEKSDTDFKKYIEYFY